MAQYLSPASPDSLDQTLPANSSQGEQVRGIDNLATGKRSNLTDILGKIDFAKPTS
jgi:hypothetical protein